MICFAVRNILRNIPIIMITTIVHKSCPLIVILINIIFLLMHMLISINIFREGDTRNGLN